MPNGSPVPVAKTRFDIDPQFNGILIEGFGCGMFGSPYVWVCSKS